MNKSMFYVSLDAKKRAPISNMRLIKKTLGFKKGAISFGMSVSKENNLNINFDVKTK